MVYVGEVYGLESIFQVIILFYVDCIGYGICFYKMDEVDVVDLQCYVDQFVEFIFDCCIIFEVCVMLNLQIMFELCGVVDYLIGCMIKDWLLIVFSIDNWFVLCMFVIDEFVKVCEVFDIIDEELCNMMIYGFKCFFFFGMYQEK